MMRIFKTKRAFLDAFADKWLLKGSQLYFPLVAAAGVLGVYARCGFKTLRNFNWIDADSQNRNSMDGLSSQLRAG